MTKSVRRAWWSCLVLGAALTPGYSFAQTRQMRIMEQLETGMLTDVEACLMLTGKLPPPGYKPLSGTMFRSNKQAAGANLPVDQVANP